MKFLATYLPTALLLVGLSTGARAQTPASPSSSVLLAPLHIVTKELPNGLRMVMFEDHATPIVNLQVWYHVGSKDEQPGRTGFAHLFEHLMFQGSAHVPPEQHTRFIEAMGGVSNAYTQEDVTVYHETFPSNYLARALWLEADRMGGLTVTQENFASERQVVEEERRLRIDNVPYGRIFEDLGSAAFTVHPYHHPVIGSMADLDKATVDDVRAFFRTFYRPDNATVVIAGDFSPEDAERMAQQYFGGIPRGPAPIPRNTLVEPPQKMERRVTKSYPNSPLPAVVMAYHMPAQFAPDAYPLELASNILSSGESSLLYRKLVYEDQVAVEADGEGNFTEDPNLFVALAVINQGKTSAEGEKDINAVLAGLKNSPLDARTLEKAKNQEIASFILGRETNEAKATALGRYAVVGKDPNRFNTELARYLGVSSADIQRVARQYFVPANLTVLTVDQPSDPAPGQAPNQAPDPALAAPPAVEPQGKN